MLESDRSKGKDVGEESVANSYQGGERIRDGRTRRLGRSNHLGTPTVQFLPVRSPLPLRSRLTRVERPKPTPIEYLAPRNIEFEQGDWMRSIIWDREKSFDRGFTKLNLNLNDTEMLLEVQDDLRTFPLSLLGMLMRRNSD